jgi:hypothetical protein
VVVPLDTIGAERKRPFLEPPDRIAVGIDPSRASTPVDRLPESPLMDFHPPAPAFAKK